jgi:hypothetical protein
VNAPIFGKYNLASTLKAKSPLLLHAINATWQLAVFPTLPQYCQPTPILLSPFLAVPVLSIIKPISFLFGNSLLGMRATLSMAD